MRGDEITVCADGRRIPSAAVEYAQELRQRLGNRVHRIILFGSHARGEATEGSDYDFAVVVDAPDPEARAATTDAGVSLLNRRSVLCAALVYSLEQWATLLRTPLGWNIEREGLAL